MLSIMLSAEYNIQIHRSIIHGIKSCSVSDCDECKDTFHVMKMKKEQL